ncbi:hypothetical protein PET01_18820 [Pediococcus ethanolidurans]|nr:hypothetical protein PET01_18820 [Pediococcus ethanolidurans]
MLVELALVELDSAETLLESEVSSELLAAEDLASDVTSALVAEDVFVAAVELEAAVEVASDVVLLELVVELESLALLATIALSFVAAVSLA